MPRRARCVLPGIPYHVTQRGVDRCATFSADEDLHTYLSLLRENLDEAEVRVWAWCLMTNHLHLVLVPNREDSLSVLMRRVHGRYAQYYNAHWSRGCVLPGIPYHRNEPPFLFWYDSATVNGAAFSLATLK